MFETLSHLALQQYWWALVSVLGGALVFLLFVQGGQSLIYTIGKADFTRTMVVNAIGRKWEFTFTTLVTFGGAFFASFPLFYSTSFGGAYWLWMLILFTFILQAVSYEYRKKPKNVFGTRTFDWFLFLNGFIGTVSLGVAVGTLFTGGNFLHNEMNFTSWANTYHGLEAFANPTNLALGFAVFFLARTVALLYFLRTISDTEIIMRSKKQMWINAPLFLVFFLTFLGLVFLSEGYAYDPATGAVFMEKYKYLNNFIEMPVIGVLFVLGVLMVLLGIFRTLFCFDKCSDKTIWPVGIGVFVVVTTLLMSLGYNNTVFYPSIANIQDGLTIENASSSKFTLTVMSYVSLLVPFVAAYIIYAWRAINDKKITKEEMEDDSDTHIY